MESHFVSPAALSILLRNPFGPDDYEDFVAERNRTLQQAMEQLLIKERLDLPPNLRELDESIEQIELKLRSLIASVLDGDDSNLPDHVAPKIRERVARALRKNPALDADRYHELAGLLEHADLRELEQIMVASQLWSRFEARFRTKEQLAKRFDQLAEARNTLRHSRTLDETTKLDGLAAIHWFGEVLR